ncbi:MAG: phage replisome organizer N-terminal domain-containing protein [Acidaminococcaceae bacterium]|nr:phage replisome organizer N-terminal domain-containing protein [Acidaminococcaceae bacterium]MBQ9634630.1 phage replisome organizer N-terminal domain-containing protein [Acidaminococcaceae bacterium]MBQ9697081.1 phage replisome organizer N-terminal domain-containing protein [Acidaminococcaceae bacterium]
MMDGLKWIKLATGIFDNRKIKQIELLPEGDSILVIWVKLLSLAGVINNCGLIYVTKDIPYTEETLAGELRRPINTVRLALATFEKFGMIRIGEDNLIQITGWAKHQGGSAAIETAAEKNKLRQQRYRDRQKMLVAMQGVSNEYVTNDDGRNVTRNVTDNVTNDVTDNVSNACRIRIRKEEEEDKDDDHQTRDSNTQIGDDAEIKKAVDMFQNTVRPIRNIYEAERIRAMVEEYGLDVFSDALRVIAKARPKVPIPYLEEVLKNRGDPPASGKNDPVTGAAAAQRILEGGGIVDFNA